MSRVVAFGAIFGLGLVSSGLGVVGVLFPCLWVWAFLPFCFVIFPYKGFSTHWLCQPPFSRLHLLQRRCLSVPCW